jgi:hypothetical protein
MNVGKGAHGWHDDFAIQQQQSPASDVNGKQFMRSQMGNVGYLPGQPISQYPLAHQQPEVIQGHNYSASEGLYGDEDVLMAHAAAFEAAFDQAEGAHSSEQINLQPVLSVGGEVAGVRLDPIFNTQISDIGRGPLQSPDNIFQQPPELQTTVRIGSDTIVYNERKAHKTAEQNKRDHDELAHTAGKLLNSISDETSSKFQQSVFLNLMRRIRDREVEVRGEEFCDVDKDGSTIRDIQTSQNLEEENHSSNPRNTQQRSEFNPPELPSADETERMLLELASQPINGAVDLQPLHPGGRRYPATLSAELVEEEEAEEAEDRHKYDHWASGGIGLDDERIEESLGLAGRFRKVSVQDDA